MRNHFILKRMADDSLFLIDIDKVLREKAPKYYKYIPGFVVSYLKRIVHQEELNVFLRDSKDKVGVDFLKACLEFLDANIVVKGRRKPTERRTLHLCLQSSIGRRGWCGLGIYTGLFL